MQRLFMCNLLKLDSLITNLEFGQNAFHCNIVTHILPTFISHAHDLASSHDSGPIHSLNSLNQKKCETILFTDIP